MFEHVLWILASLVLLSLGAEGLVRGASALARRIGMSPFTIGLTECAYRARTNLHLNSRWIPIE